VLKYLGTGKVYFVCGQNCVHTLLGGGDLVVMRVKAVSKR
jgi:hypothetical protein